MKRSKFKIGQVSKMMGIAPETIRHYERKKIITPPKDTDNGYRQFDIVDVCILGKARTYLRYGFSLEEAQDLLAAEDIGQIRTQLEKRAQAIEQNVREELARLGGLQKKLADINAFSGSLGRFSIRNRPTILCDQHFENAVPLVHEESPSRAPILLENQLVTFPYLEFRRDEFMRGELKNCNVGIAVWEGDAPSIGLEDYAGLQIYPAASCIYTSVIMRLDESYNQSLAPVVAFLQRSGIPLAGNVFCRTISTHRKGSDYLYYRDVWMPIAQDQNLSC